MLNRMGRLLTATIAVLAAGLIAGTSARAALPAFEKLLPAETRLFVACRSVADMTAAMDATKFGKIFDDELLKPFMEDARKELETRLAEAESVVGLRLVDLKGLTDGQVAVAVIALPNQTATVLLVDVTNHEKQLAVVRQKIGASLAQRNAQSAPYKSTSGATGTHYTIPPKAEGGRQVEVVDALIGGDGGSLWVVSDCAPGAEVVVAAAKAGGVKGLAEVPAFATLMDRTKSAAGEPGAHFAAFADPLGLALALRNYEWPQKRHKPDAIAVFQQAGFDGILGIGGQVIVGSGQLGVKARIELLAKKPYTKSLQMLTVQPGPDFAPQPWVTADVVGYATLYWDVETAFMNFGPLFGGFLEEDETIWLEVIESLKTDPDGPQVDLIEEFIKLVGPRVTAVVDTLLPVDPNSSEILLAVEIKGATPEEKKANSDRVLATIRKAFLNDQTVQKLKLGELELWKLEAKEEVPEGPQREEPGVVDGLRTVFTAYVTVWNDHLMMSGDTALLQKVMQAQGNGLAVAPDYVAVTGELAKSIPEEIPAPVALGFIRLADLIRIDYELFRTGKMKGSTTLLGRLLDVVLRDRETGKPLNRDFTGAKLPDFNKIKHYFSPIGLIISDLPDGLFAVGFTLENAPPNPVAPAPAAAPAPAGK